MLRVHARSRRRAAWSIALGSVLLVSGLALDGSVSQGATITTAPPGDSPVPQGVNPTLDNAATANGPTNPNQVVDVSFILKERNYDQLASEVESGWTGPYLTVAQFASQYAPPPSVDRQLVNYLESFGIEPAVDANGLDVTSTGTIAEYEQALNISEENYTLQTSSGTQSFYASSTNPSLPTAVANNLLVILGVTDFAPFVDSSLHALAQPVATTASGSGIPKGELVPSDFSTRYDLNPLLKAGDLGQGQTMGIVTLASFTPSVPETFWTQYLGLATTPNRIDPVTIDGGAGPVSLKNGSDETTIDVEQSGAIAPNASIVVYEAPNTDYGFQDGFEAAASQDTAGSVSTSWGSSETILQVATATGMEPDGLQAAFDEVFAEMGAQGQSTFAASGDSGAYGPSGDIGTTNLGVQNPSNSPLTTAAGATTLPGTQTYPVLTKAGKVTGTESVTIPSEMTWGWDYLWPLHTALAPKAPTELAFAQSAIAGSGGGYSQFEDAPSYQSGLAGSGLSPGNFSDYQFLTPIDPKDQGGGIDLPTSWTFTPTPALGAGTGSGRMVPDLAFNGDPQTGYAVYFPQYTKPFGGPVQMLGGTSFIAPQLNAVTAVYESALGHRVGFWNPVIYGAATATNSPFTPLDSDTLYGSANYAAAGTGSIAPGASFANGNLFYTGTPASLFNPGSGLGTADLSALEGFFAAG